MPYFRGQQECLWTGEILVHHETLGSLSQARGSGLIATFVDLAFHVVR